MNFDTKTYLDNPFVNKHLSYMQKLSLKLCKKSGDANVQMLSYIKQSDHGKSLELCTHLEWLSHKNKNYNIAQAVLPRLSIGSQYWKNMSNEIIKSMNQDAKTLFNMDAIIEMAYRDNLQNCYHLYSFYSNAKSAYKAQIFYLRHKAELFRVISDLNNHGCQYFDINTEANTIASRVSGYSFQKRDLKDFQKCSDLLGEKLFYKLSNYEMEILVLYGSGGFTAKQIGYLLHKSQKAIEYHLGQIRNKTNLKDRRAMNAYAREKGWDKLVNFYSNLSTSLD